MGKHGRAEALFWELVNMPSPCGEPKKALRLPKVFGRTHTRPTRHVQKIASTVNAMSADFTQS